VFSFYLQKQCDESYFYVLKLLQTCAMVWRPVRVFEKFWCSQHLKGLQWCAFTLGGNPTNLQNCEVWTPEKRGMNVYIVNETVLQTLKKEVSISLIYDKSQWKLLHILSMEKKNYVRVIIKFLIIHAAATTAYSQWQNSVPDNINKRMSHLNNCSFDKIYVQNWVQQFCFCWEAHCH
jgi:hypothetical protein